MTVTSGSLTKFFNLAAISCSNLSGVCPAACTSPTNGREIFPSDRTGTDRESSGSCQTLIANTSSLPITNVLSCALEKSGLCAGCSLCAAEAGGALGGVVCAHSPVDKASRMTFVKRPFLQELPMIPVIATPLRFWLILMSSRFNLLSRFLYSGPTNSFSCPEGAKGTIPELSSHTAQSCRESYDSLHPTNARLPSDSILSFQGLLRWRSVLFPTGRSESWTSATAGKKCSRPPQPPHARRSTATLARARLLPGCRAVPD